LPHLIHYYLLRVDWGIGRVEGGGGGYCIELIHTRITVIIFRYRRLVTCFSVTSRFDTESTCFISIYGRLVEFQRAISCFFIGTTSFIFRYGQPVTCFSATRRFLPESSIFKHI
ncbi:unnamed protein product, partial [Prunus brigantina]